jgi:hypothetical protein
MCSIYLLNLFIYLCILYIYISLSLSCCYIAIGTSTYLADVSPVLLPHPVPCISSNELPQHRATRLEMPEGRHASEATARIKLGGPPFCLQICM